MDLLKTIVGLSHEFGTEEFVKGGGGNSSCKNIDSLWVKPSGTTLSEISEAAFVVLEREKINRLFTARMPSIVADREALVKTIMADAVKFGSNARPSVEAPLHHMLNAVYVVHTHPALANGMTCGKNGKEKCAELFPESLWVEYFDPGFSLCSGLMVSLEEFKTEHGKEPELIFLKNHGVIVASNTAAGIRKNYKEMMTILMSFYQSSAISMALPEEVAVSTEAEKQIKLLLGKDGFCTRTNAPFKVSTGPLSPDHVVFGRGYPFTGELTKENVDSYKDKYGCLPRVFCTNEAVITSAATQNIANLALSLSRDAALVMRLTSAFGGTDFMTERAHKFIENWEVESYRSKVAEG